MVFGKKKKIEEAERKAEQAKKEELKRALSVAEIQMPGKEEFTPYTSEYLTFLGELKQKPVTWYEKACAFAEKILPVTPDEKAKAKIDDALRAGYTNATAKGAFSFAIFSTLIVLIIVFYCIVFLDIGMVFGLFGIFTVLGTFWYFYNYPNARAKSMGIKMSSDSVLAILYMIIYMRSSPNLEGAIKFAAQNLEGPLAWDLRKLLWDIETGKYASADTAMIEYTFKWKNKNREFAEALNLLRGSSVEASRREIVYEETLNVILNGTRERAKHYAAGLRMPMTLIYAMGVLLPVMGLVLFPIILIFIADYVKPSFVFFGYDILLPAFLYFLVSYLLSSKPPTFSPPDISKAKGVPPMGKFSLTGKFIPILPLALITTIPFVLIGWLGLASEDAYFSVNFSLLIVFGLALTIISYTFLDSYQKIKVRKDIERIEDEFATALFQLGNAISGGAPLESAIDKAKANLKEMKIADMFDIISLNMKKFGYTFEEAMFNKEVGALWYYPSKLIHSIMQIVIQSAKKNIRSAASSMIVISRYLKGVHEVKEEIDDILGETTSSMQFLAMFLTPMVAGVTVTLAVVILQILQKLGAAMQGIMASAGNFNTYQTFFLVPWAMGGTLPITPAAFQIIVGIYMIETGVLLAVFLNGISYGEDPVGMRQAIWTTLLFAILIYIISWFVTYSMFGGMITSILEPVGT
jgi:Flp pilus assembly protein TadB